MTRRQKQIGQAIRREISDILSRDVSDPRIKGIITVTGVDLSPDLTRAKIFISTMSDEAESIDLFDGLDSASRYLRRELGERLRLRYVPELEFHRDESIERGNHLLQLIDQMAVESIPE